MKLIRKNVFETNSSSTHVISITKNKGYILPKCIYFNFGEFGWDYKVFYDTKDKASYLYTMIKYFFGNYRKEYNKGEKYISMIKKYLDSDNIKYYFEDIGKENGYVDHGANESAFEFIESILSSKDRLYRYLFNDKSYVSTGNDNDRGYYIPDYSFEYDDIYDDWEKQDELFNNKIKELEKDNEIYFKGN